MTSISLHRGIYVYIFLAILFHSVNAQKPTDSLNFKFQDLPFEAVLQQATDLSGYFFSYNADIIPEGSLFTYNKKNSLPGFLDDILVGTSISYSFYEDQIILRHPYQDRNWFTISGNILSHGENKPLSGVNVYLDATTQGAVSDVSGKYKIDMIPFGTYNLVFSHVGYKLKAYKLTSKVPTDRLIDVTMETSTLELDSVQIKADPIAYFGKYVEYVSKFNDNFLGYTENADKCKILNPGALIYNEKDESDVITFKAIEPLEIINRALGYKIYYDLELYFDENDTVQFYGKARFEELYPKSKRIMRNWRKKRDATFQGSMKHFLISLINGSTRRDGFLVYQVDGDTTSRSVQEVERPRSLIEQQEAGSYVLKIYQPTFVVYTHREKNDKYLENNTEEDLLEKYEGVLGVRDFLRRYRKYQISALQALNNPIIIDENGNFKTPLNFMIHGYLSLERTADLLPINYR